MSLNWFGRSRNAQRRPVRRPTTGHPRLRLENLEDRAVPATFFVNTALDDVIPGNGKQSLREAITRANTNPVADVIVVPAGVFKITIAGAGEDANLAGDFDIAGTVTIQGAGSGITIIDGQQLDRVFDVFGTAPSSIKVVLQGLTVRNGNVTDHGGGILLDNADLVLRDSAVTGNRASLSGGGISNGLAPGTGDVRVVRTTVAHNLAGTSGGGLFVQNSSLIDSVLTVRDSTIRRNVAGSDGGGIAAHSANLTNSTISGNKAGSVSGGDGGGVWAVLTTLTDCTIGGNSAFDGDGGGVWAQAVAELTRSHVSGNFSAGSGGANGGGIWTDVATLEKSTVTGNSATGFGGGITANTASLTGSTVGGNTALGGGGGLLVNSAALLNCTVKGNSAGGHAGGLGADAEVTLTNCTVSSNTAFSFGGGISADTVTLTNSTVSGNSAGGYGGGLAAGIGTLTNSTVSGNAAFLHGGGLVIGTAELTNSTISGNTAGTEGGGLFATEATLLNCTVAENIARTGGGLFHSMSGTFSVRNTIVALNLVDFTGTGPDVSGAFTSQGHNLIGDGTGSTGFANGVNGDQVGTIANPIDPKLGQLANNGGKTRTRGLLAGSRAIDAGDNTNLPPTDQRGPGFPRQKDGNFNGLAIVDIGAFEK